MAGSHGVYGKARCKKENWKELPACTCLGQTRIGLKNKRVTRSIIWVLPRQRPLLKHWARWGRTVVRTSHIGPRISHLAPRTANNMPHRRVLQRKHQLMGLKPMSVYCINHFSHMWIPSSKFSNAVNFHNFLFVLFDSPPGARYAQLGR